MLNPTGSLDVNLPSAGTAGTGYKYNIKNLSTYTITINGYTVNSETIDGSASVDISTQYSSLTLVSDGSDWFII